MLKHERESFDEMPSILLGQEPVANSYIEVKVKLIEDLRVLQKEHLQRHHYDNIRQAQ